ncbi:MULTISPECIES: SRPBCC family protein [unclassified Marinovum]
MEFTSKEDIEAPIEQVFAALSDVDAMERQALRRGATVRRITSTNGATEGMQWTAGFKFRGREMQAEIELCRYAPPEALVFQGKAGGLETELDVDLTALSPSRTRMSVTARLAPKTLSSRLVVQSLKLAKGRVTRKFAVRVAQFAKTLEERARKLG